MHPVLVASGVGDIYDVGLPSAVRATHLPTSKLKIHRDNVQRAFRLHARRCERKTVLRRGAERRNSRGRVGGIGAAARPDRLGYRIITTGVLCCRSCVTMQGVWY